MVSNPIPTCNQELRKMGKVYPRTCRECGLGPCKLFTPPPNPTVTVNDTERKDFESAMNQARFFPAELSFERIKSPSGRDEYRNSHLQSAWEGWQAALSIEAQPEVTGAVAYLDYNGVLKPTRDGVITMKKGDNLYPASAIEAAVRQKLEEIHRICEVEKAGYDEPPSGWDRTDPTHAEYFGYQQACDDIAERIRALMESPQPSVEEPAN